MDDATNVAMGGVLLFLLALLTMWVLAMPNLFFWLIVIAFQFPVMAAVWNRATLWFEMKEFRKEVEKELGQ